MNNPHPAVALVLGDSEESSLHNLGDEWLGRTTSTSLAQVLAIGCLAGLDPEKKSLKIWDPAAGTGFAGQMLVGALRSSGVHVDYRGQELDIEAAKHCEQRFSNHQNVHIAVGDTLLEDLHPGFEADLVIVDAPWGMSWGRQEDCVRERHEQGEFRFGLPRKSDSTWLFVSLALEKLRAPENGGGRVAALVAPSALSSHGVDSEIRESILEQGLLESVTWLPNGLAPNTQIGLYLLVFNNAMLPSRAGKAQIANLQTEFTDLRGKRILKPSALIELESALRKWKPGPRNRTVSVEQFNRFEGRVRKPLTNGALLGWTITTFNNTHIDEEFLLARYGEGHTVTLEDSPTKVVDLDPKRIMKDETKALIKAINASGFPMQRLSNLVTAEIQPLMANEGIEEEGSLLIPISINATVSMSLQDASIRPQRAAVVVDQAEILPEFLETWLNSDVGYTSRSRALDVAASGHIIRAVRAETRAYLKWADELIVPTPDLETQSRISALSRQLLSYQAELEAIRSTIWKGIEEAEQTASQIAGAFEESLESWLDHLPHPIASALWTAHAASTPSAQKTSYIHAWEAIVAFHATVLLSAIRSDVESSRQIESSIRETMAGMGLTIERPSFGTWVIIFETVASKIRQILAKEEDDDISRVRKSFAGLSVRSIEKLVSSEIVSLFKQLNSTRNRWLGHAGYSREEDHAEHIEVLVSQLHKLRQLLGNVWSQLTLVRAGMASKKRARIDQTVELAMGTRSPFATHTVTVETVMDDGELYLVVAGSETPLKLATFVQLHSAPRSAQFTSYFYNRTEGNDVHMVTYQFSSETEHTENIEDFQAEFGALIE